MDVKAAPCCWIGKASVSDSAGTTLLREQLQRWTAAGLIDADQAGRIEAAEAARAQAQPRKRLPLVAEVLGYLGAVLAATAIAVALGQVWKNVPPVAWLTLAAVLAVGFLIAGALIRPGSEPAFARLRSVLWLLATASAAGVVAVLMAKFLHVADSNVALSVAGAWLICAVPLWWRTRSAVQHVAAFGGAIALIETGLDRFDPHAGTLSYGCALGALALAWGAA